MPHRLQIIQLIRLHLPLLIQSRPNPAMIHILLVLPSCQRHILAFPPFLQEQRLGRPQPQGPSQDPV